MKLDLDPDELREQMALWRSAVDLKLAMRADLRSHMMVRRKDILTNFSKTGRDWMTVLRACRPEPDAAPAYEALCAEVKDFTDWASRELEELARLSREGS